MLYTTTTRLRFLITLGLLYLAVVGRAQAWNPNHAIGSQSGRYHFSYVQVPDPLVELYAAAFPNTGLTYQWESSPTPVPEDFVAVSNGSGSTYNFPAPLTRTAYYRRKTTYSNGSYIHSNIIKISVVSVNWEDRNYIREHDITKTGLNDWISVDQLSIGQKLQTTTYLDGLGRSVQTISRETATPSSGSGPWGDVVQYSLYDAYGREPVKYLPYTTTTEPGKFKTTYQTEQPQYYTTGYNESSAYSTLTFDNSPLGRVKNVKEPGGVWAASAGKSVSYDLNDAANNVRIFLVDYVQGNPPVVSGVYPANTLYKTSYTDENNKSVIEYANKSGQVILKKVQLDNVPSGPHAGWICTYYIYDEFGQLRFELSPEAVKYLDNNSWSFTGTGGQQVLNELCFQYSYDEKGRSTWKKTPGAAPLRMLYDKRDRTVLTQDGNQAALSTPQWTATLYDELDRPVLTALYNTTKSEATLRSDIAGAAATGTLAVNNSANTGGGTINLSTSFNPLTSTDLNTTTVTTALKYVFYDTYSFLHVKSFNTGYTNLSSYGTSDPNVQPIGTTSRTAGMATGSKTRILGTYNFLNATSYYDERGSLVQTLKDNIKSGVDITTLQYHFDGRVLSSCTDHTTAGTGYTNFKILTKYNFDKLGRVASIQKQFSTNAFKTISAYDYDDVGRIKVKHLDPGYTGSGGSELEALQYSYNIHGQLTGINKDYALKTPGSYSKWGHFFGLYLGFDNRDNVFASARLNGQAAGVVWNTQGDDAQRKYEYSYDNADRLIKADFTERQLTGEAWSNAKMDFSVSGYNGKIEYDGNGNLLAMLQKGVMPGQAAPLTIDDLRYSYAAYSNKLQSVTDLMSSTNVNGRFGDLKDGTNGGAPDYVYDNNGNVVADLNKNAKELNNLAGGPGIRYNFLDKPDQIRLAGKGVISIVYSGDGEKLQRTFTPESGTPTTTTYIGQFVYQASGANPDALAYISFEEGRVRVITPTGQNNGYDQLAVDGNMDLPGGKKGVYDYFIMDYQQNVRMVLTEEARMASNTATMETARASAEEPVFGQTGSANEVASTRYPKPEGWSGNTSASVSRLGNWAGKNIGPNTLQKVMAGDVVSASVQYYYNQPASGNNNNFVNTLLGSLVQALSGGPTASVVKEGATGINSQLGVNSSFISAVQPSTGTGTTPLAYLTVLFFDERFQFISAQNGGAYQQQVASSVGSGGGTLPLPGIKAPKNGYCYVYVSNQSDGDVYFDNLQVTLDQGRILEENHYYSFGLKIAAISSKKYSDSYDGDVKNLYQMQGAFAELDEDIGWNDFALRNYDAQVGRWVQQDPFQQFASPYSGMGNDPVNGTDPSGGVKLPYMNFNVLTAPIQVAGATSKSIIASQVLIKTAGIIIKVFKAVEIVGKAVATAQVGYSDPIIQRLNRIVQTPSINNQLNSIWRKSFNATKTKVKEHAITFVSNLNSKGERSYGWKNEVEGDDGGVKSNHDIGENETLEGDAHTHPYSKSQGSLKEMAFSPEDIDKLYENVKDGFIAMVEAGTTRFALVITDKEKALDFFTGTNLGQIRDKYNEVVEKGRKEGKSVQQSIIDAVNEVIGKDGVNGIKFYQTTDHLKQSFKQVN